MALISQVQKPMCGIAQPCSMIVRNNVRIRRLLVPEPFLETSILTIHKAQFDTEKKIEGRKMSFRSWPVVDKNEIVTINWEIFIYFQLSLIKMKHTTLFVSIS